MTRFDEPHLEEVEGDTFSKTISITDKNGNGKDITGWTFYVTVKETLDEPDSEAVLSTDVTSHDNATEGQTSFSFPASETEELSDGAGYYFFEMKYEDTSGTVETIVQRRISFKETVRQTL